MVSARTRPRCCACPAGRLAAGRRQHRRRRCVQLRPSRPIRRWATSPISPRPSRAQLAAQISGSNLDAASLATYAQGWLDDLQTQLNGQVGGVYVFGGEAVGTAPGRLRRHADYDPATAG
ncbi:hypothetical protein ACRAWD_22590 [Caulobacter segnis]